MPETESQLIDTDTRYADPSDVGRYLRNIQFDNTSEPSQTEVEDILDGVSEEIDNLTNRAWRTRQVQDYEARINASYSQEKGRLRSRRRFGRQQYRSTRLTGERVTVNLPHLHLKDIDSGEGDEVTILQPRSENEITTQEGRGDAYVVDYRRGVLKIRVDYITKVAESSKSFLDLDENQRIKVSYRYGRSQIPQDIQRAAAKLAAAEIIETDAYGEVLPSGGENTPDQNQAAESLRNDAREVLSGYRYVNRV